MELSNGFASLLYGKPSHVNLKEMFNRHLFHPSYSGIGRINSCYLDKVMNESINESSTTVSTAFEFIRVVTQSYY